MTDESTAPGELESPAPVEPAPVEPTESTAEGDTPAEAPAATDQPGISAKDAFEHPEVQKRLKETTWRYHEAQRQLDSILQAQVVEPVKAVAEPKVEDFEGGEFSAEYRKAVIDYAGNLAKQQADARFAELMEQQRKGIAERTFRSREAEFVREAKDYEAVVSAIPVTEVAAAEIVQSEIGPEIHYYLGKNPELARAIAALPPAKVAREIARIEGRLLAEKDSRPKAAPIPTTKAPSPPPKLETSAEVVDEDPDKMPIEKWVKLRQKQVLKTGR